MTSDYTYKLCLAALAKGTLTMDMLDAFLTCKRLTPEQYRELAEKLIPPNP